MPGRSPAGPLVHEHRVIERMLAVLERELDSMRAEGLADPRVIDIGTDFIRTYADRCHHGKEEDILFARLATKDLEPEFAEGMRRLIEDHVYGRMLTRQVVDANQRYRAGDGSALSVIESGMQSLIEFYPVHIRKEDRLYFKPFLEYFTDAEKTEMLDAFDEFDRSLIHAKYLGIVEDLEQSHRPTA
jgi:hemerythrin-like domain-containing protein